MKKAAPIRAFGEYLRKLRESQRNPRLRSQGGVAQWLREHGVSVDASTLSKYEKGRPQIDTATLWMLGEAFDGVTPEDLMRRYTAERLNRPVESVPAAADEPLTASTIRETALLTAFRDLEHNAEIQDHIVAQTVYFAAAYRKKPRVSRRQLSVVDGHARTPAPGPRGKGRRNR